MTTHMSALDESGLNDIRLSTANDVLVPIIRQKFKEAKKNWSVYVKEETSESANTLSRATSSMRSALTGRFSKTVQAAYKQKCEALLKSGEKD